MPVSNEVTPIKDLQKTQKFEKQNYICRNISGQKGAEII